MSEYSNSDTLGALLQQLRSPENNLQYLKQQMYILAQILFLQGEKEEGLERAAMGGMFFCMERMRELWNTPEEPTKTLQELSDIYAGVELKRFLAGREAVMEKVEELKKDFIRVNPHRFEVNGQVYYVLSSPVKQTTREGKQLLPGEMLDTADAGVPKFLDIAQYLINNQGSNG